MRLRFYIGKIFEKSVKEKEEILKKIWLSQGIYVYSRIEIIIKVMIKLIKKSEEQKVQFNVGDQVKYIKIIYGK
jgi:hypothetical protein